MRDSEPSSLEAPSAPIVRHRRFMRSRSMVLTSVLVIPSGALADASGFDHPHGAERAAHASGDAAGGQNGHGESKSIHVMGRTTRIDRAPLSGAVIVSDLGGQAVSGADGSFSLEIAIPSGTTEVALTAVGWRNGVTLHAQRLTAIPPHAHSVSAGEMQMQSQGTCDPTWLPTFGDAPGMGGYLVAAFAMFDDGTGPALFVGGSFQTAGSVVASNIAKWNGSEWLPLGAGVESQFNPAVSSLVVHDAGDGPALYAGGAFTKAGGVNALRVAKWNGESWSPVGSGFNNTVQDLVLFDDGLGGGEALYACGNFGSSGGATVLRIAKWNGAAWLPVGGGMNDIVVELQPFDDDGDSQPSLYAAGSFTAAGGNAALHIARWNGTAWSPVGGGFTAPGGSSPIEAMAVHDDGSGSGPRLVVAGVFTAAGGVPAQNIAAWNGTKWSALGSGIDGYVIALWSLDLGSGQSLFAGGSFVGAGGVAVNRIARWNGTEWLPVGGGASNTVRALSTMDFGAGPRLVVGGEFRWVGDAPASRVAVWDGEAWSRIRGSGFDDNVASIAVFPGNECCEPSLVVAGGFTSIGGQFFNHIARWDGARWQPLGDGLDDFVHSLLVFDEGNGMGPSLFAGGDFEHSGEVSLLAIARWDGESWSSVGVGLSGSNDRSVEAMEIFDDGSGSGPALFVGGRFSGAGAVTLNNIGKWDGTTWSKLKNGVFGGTSPKVRSLGVYKAPGDAAAKLYVGGNFTLASSVNTPYIARWDGVNWTGVGGGMGSTVLAFAVYDAGLGEGPVLYAGGGFLTAGGVSAKQIARWNGTNWAPVGGGMDGSVWCLTVFDDGSGDGPALYAGGGFDIAGTVTANHIARWDGVSWSGLGDGLQSSVSAITEFDDGSGGGRALYIGGTFGSSPGGDSYLAKWQSCTADCNSDGLYDWSQIENGTLIDANGNGIPDCCEFGGKCLPCFDLTGDGEVDGDDLGVVLGGWGTASISLLSPDLNGDGAIDIVDLCLLLDHWGPCEE